MCIRDSSNYHPQGICYDHQGGQLAFAQQGTSRIDFLTVGQPGRTGSISTGLRHQTSVACDSDRFLVVDYTGNANREDMHRISRNGARSVHWNERAGYGGFPVAVFGDELADGPVATLRLEQPKANSPHPEEQPSADHLKL